MSTPSPSPSYDSRRWAWFTIRGRCSACSPEDAGRGQGETHCKRRPSGTKKLEYLKDNDFLPCLSWQGRSSREDAIDRAHGMSIESVWEIRLRSVRPGLNRAGVRRSPGRGHQLSGLRVDRAPSVALRSASGIRARARRALDIAAVDDLDCRTLLAKHDSAGIDARDMERHDEHRHCRLSLRHPRPVRRRAAPVPVFPRCRLPSDRAIALASAPSEAAQTRLRYINGIRDDLLPVEYEDQVNLNIIEALLDAYTRRAGPICSAGFQALPEMIWFKTCTGSSRTCAGPGSPGSSRST